MQTKNVRLSDRQETIQYELAIQQFSNKAIVNYVNQFNPQKISE